jgi:hypothetical protein
VLTHHPRDPLVIDPLIRRNTVVELGRDPRCPTGLVLLVDGPDPHREPGVGRGPLLMGRGGSLPGVVGGSLDLDELAQPLHLVGGGVVGDELEATHQFVSPAKYLAAARRISRSVVSLVSPLPR